jgi:acyl carrier protein
MDRNVIFGKIKEHLIADFRIEAELIGLEKNLSDDLDLDSLDMVDLLIHLKDHIGEKVNPGLFKNARTLQDVVDLVQPLWSA